MTSASYGGEGVLLQREDLLGRLVVSLVRRLEPVLVLEHGIAAARDPVDPDLVELVLERRPARQVTEPRGNNVADRVRQLHPHEVEGTQIRHLREDVLGAVLEVGAELPSAGLS